MTVGIHMRYQRCESTWIGLQVGSWLKAEGHGCSVLSLGARSQYVHPEWDNAVSTDYKQDFKQWAKKHSHVVWFNDVSLFNILQAKAQRVKTIVVASWEDPLTHADLYANADRVVCLSPSLAKRIRAHMQLDNVYYIPLDLPTMSSVKPIMLRPDRPRILLNLRGPRKQQLGSSLVPMLTRLFHSIPAEWTIWIPRSMRHKKSWIHKCMKSPHRDSSFKIHSDADWVTQRLLYGWHDLTIWPTIHGGHALTVLLSLAMGAPIATFDIPPANEYVSKNNGVLAPCQVCYNPNGIAQLVPDLARYENLVTKLVASSGNLLQLKKHTADWADERRKLFNAAWREVLS